MKICISSSGQEKTSLVDERFGRCPYFVAYDTKTKEYSAAVNKGVAASGGAGIAAAQTVIDMKADAVITGNMGPNAMELLQANGIKIYQTTGNTVEAAVQEFKSARGVELSKPVPAHSGMGRNNRRGW
ncbi:MAG TPA: NifB/NifX family molybdenum-iron cluster-binding protein [Clostridia bacterium]|nr:NifB/NifX family molybdenum-iron cluster-binding protein [Clostridia bacterium]